MYLWKCWRDSSLYFVVFLISVLVCLSFMGTGARTPDGGVVAGLLLAMTALGMGAAVAKEEFSDGTVHFLFTKPRSRSYFVWMGWLAGCLELAAIAGAALAMWLIALIQNGETAGAALRFFVSSKQGDVPGRLVGCLLLYCLTFALTALFRNGGEGLGVTLLIALAVPSLRLLFRLKWHIELPSPAGQIGSLPIAVSYLVWTAIALAFVGAAQWYMEATEPK